MARIRGLFFFLFWGGGRRGQRVVYLVFFILRWNKRAETGKMVYFLFMTAEKLPTKYIHAYIIHTVLIIKTRSPNVRGRRSLFS